MKKPETNFSNASNLRQKAEEALKQRKDEIIPTPLNESDLLKLVHELQVHQIELELQNEELVLARQHEEIAKEKYTSLFDFAPTAYFNVSQKGMISELNFAGARMLGKERSKLINARLAQFIFRDTHSAFDDFFSQSFKSQQALSCEVLFGEGEASGVFAHLIGAVSETGTHCLITAVDITERKRSEKLLLERGELLALSQQIAHVGSWSHDLKTGLISWTDEVYRIFGLSPQEFPMTMDFILQSIPPEDKPIIEEVLSDSLRSLRTDYEFEHRIRRRDTGEIRIVVERFVNERDRSGEPVRTVGMIQDITERKKSEQEILGSEKKFQRIFETVQEVYFEASVDGTLLEVSPSVEKISKGLYTREEMIGQSFVSMYANPEERDLYFSKLLENKSVSDYELSILNKDNSIIPIAVSSILVCDEEGKPVIISGILREISERKNAEHALKETLEQLNQANLNLERRVEERTLEILGLSSLQNAILANSPLAILTINEQGIFQSINPAGEKMLGYSAAEVVGHLSPFAFHDRDELLEVCFRKTGNPNPPDEEIFQVVLEYLSHKTTEWTWVRKNGEKFPIRLTHSPIMDDQGNLQGHMGLISDLSEEKRAGQSLRESEARFHTMFYDHTAVMLLINPETGDIIEANKAAEHFYGLPFNSQPKLSISSIHVATPEDIRNELNEAMLMLRNYFVSLHKVSTGEVRTVEVHSTPISVKREKVLFSIIHDITERKEAENALRKSEAENRAILQAVPDLMFRIHRDGTYLDSHSQNESSLYVPKEYFVGKTVLEILPPDLAKQSMDAIEKALTTGEVVQYEYSLRVHDKDCYYENRMLAISDDEVLSIIRDITQRKESETALQMQSAAFESFALPIIITDPQGRIQWVNSAFAQLTGYAIDETIGQSPGKLISSGEQDKEFYKSFWETLQNKKVWSGEIVNRRKDGSLYFEEETITPVLDAQGNVSSFIAIKIDISDRKRLYQELAGEKRRLADIIKGTNAGTWEWNIQTGETIFNEQWAEMLGYTLEEISPVSIETWVKFAHPDDLKISGLLLEKHFRGDIDYYSFVSRMRHKNGDWMWVLDRGRVHEWDQEGKPLLMSGTHQDITEQKRAEIALLESDKKLSAMISNISDVIGIMNPDGILQYLSPNIENYFGWKPEELVGMDGFTVVHPDDFERIREDYFRLIQKPNASVTVEFQYRCRDEAYKPIELTAVNLIQNTVINGILLNYHDISLRKKTQEDLIKAKREAEAANLAKSEFLSRMSHELRTPLNSILGFAQLMELGDLNPKYKKGVAHILNNGKHLLNLINEVLDISGIEAGKQVLSPEPVNIEGIILEIIDIIQIAANNKKVRVELADSPTNALYLLADRFRLKQVLINLFNNAIKYNKEGGVVTILAQCLSEDNTDTSQVRISITDTGNGINPADLGKLFQPFERIGADQTETEGTGLGLMVVKKLTEAMGGKVGVESEPGTGSTFWIVLPLANPTGSKTKQDGANPLAELHDSKPNNSLLYIEDNQSNIFLIEEILQEYRPGTTLSSTGFAKHAIDLALENKPGIILLDLDISDNQGSVILEKLLASARTMGIPVIILSEDASPSHIGKLKKAGASFFLTKPLDVEQFLKVLDLNLKK